MIAETRSYLFRWRSRRLRRCFCLSFLLLNKVGSLSKDEVDDSEKIYSLKKGGNLPHALQLRRRVHWESEIPVFTERRREIWRHQTASSCKSRRFVSSLSQRVSSTSKKNHISTNCISVSVTDEDNPSKVMSDIIVKFKSFSTKWNGIMGSDHLPRYCC